MKSWSRMIVAAIVATLIVGLVPAALAQDVIESVCLVTDIGNVDDGTFNQFAFEGMEQAADEFDLATEVIETSSETEYTDNINTCIEEGFDTVVTVGFLITDATLEAARENSDVWFIGVDQDVEGVDDAPENYVGIQYREDQAGFLVGALAAMWANELGEDTIAGVYGIDVPAVVRFRSGYEQGAKFINPEWEVGENILGTFADSFNDEAQGISIANQFIGEGAAVIFGAGGKLGSAAIKEAASQEVYVVGVDQDEYFTTFGEGQTEGAEFLMSSAMKRVDRGVFEMLEILAEGNFDDFPGGENFILNVNNEGVGFAPKHEADVPDEFYDRVAEIEEMLAEGELETGVDPVSGELLEDVE